PLPAAPGSAWRRFRRRRGRSRWRGAAQTSVSLLQPVIEGFDHTLNCTPDAIRRSNRPELFHDALELAVRKQAVGVPGIRERINSADSKREILELLLRERLHFEELQSVEAPVVEIVDASTEQFGLALRNEIGRDGEIAQARKPITVEESEEVQKRLFLE